MRGLGSVAAARPRGHGRDPEGRISCARAVLPPGFTPPAPGAVPRGFASGAMPPGSGAGRPPLGAGPCVACTGLVAGRPRGEANGNYKTGEHTAEVREARRLVQAILRGAKEAEAIV